MEQSITSHESMRAKFLLVSLAIIIIGMTFAVIPVQATQMDANVQNLPIASTTTFNLGYAQSGYIVNAYISAVGTLRLVIKNVDADLTLFSNFVSNQPFTMPPITNSIPGTIQVQVIPFSGASATLNASIQHSTMTYPLQIPGLALLVAGAAIVLTRVVKIGITVSPPTPAH